MLSRTSEAAEDEQASDGAEEVSTSEGRKEKRQDARQDAAAMRQASTTSNAAEADT